MRGRQTMLRVAVGLGTALAVVLASLLLTGPAAGAQGASGGIYVALGDSYTSAPLVPNQHGDPIDCGRSDQNYPSLVAGAFQPETFIDVSCGSAETKHMTEPQTDLPAGGTNPPQFNGLRSDATLVTVGIGGNDAGLVGVAEMCAQLGATQPFGTACRDHYAPGGNDTVDAKIEATRPKIDAVLAGIHQRSPFARVAIVGYPDVLPIDGTNCYPMVPLSPDDVNYIDGLIRRINAMIAQEAARSDAEYIDTYADSIGHDVCKAPPNRWFEGLVPTEPAYPLHPNAKGEASMARSAIAALSQPPPEGLRPRVKGLKVKPKHPHGRNATVRYKLNRDANVTIVRQRVGAKGKRASQTILSGNPSEAGVTKVRLRVRVLGPRRGKYRLFATASGTDGTQGVRAAKARYRITGKRK